MRINIRQYTDTHERMAFVSGTRTKPRKYTLTSSSLMRVERLAIQKTTRRYTMLGHNIIETDYIMSM